MFVGRFVASNRRNAADRNTMMAKVPSARQNVSMSLFFFKKFELVVEVCIENFKQGKSWMVLHDWNAKLVPSKISDIQFESVGPLTGVFAGF